MFFQPPPSPACAHTPRAGVPGQEPAAVPQPLPPEVPHPRQHHLLHGDVPGHPQRHVRDPCDGDTESHLPAGRRTPYRTPCRTPYRTASLSLWCRCGGPGAWRHGESGACHGGPGAWSRTADQHPVPQSQQCQRKSTSPPSSPSAALRPWQRP